MKKFLAPLLLALSSTSFAGTTATLQLKGTIQPILDISIQAEGVANNLVLTSNANNLKVASVTEKANSSNGYKVTLSSANSGVLKNGNASFAYTISYGGQSNLNLNSPQVVSYQPTAGVQNRDVMINYTGSPQENLLAGDYTDTITFNIAAN